MTTDRGLGRAAARAIALALGASTALAVDVPIPAKVFLQKPGKKTKIVSKGDFPLPDPNLDDPTVEGGSIRFSSSLDPTGTTFELAPGSWKLLGKPEAPKGYKSKNGGCKVVLVKPNVVKALCPPVYLGPLPLDPNADIRTVLTVGAGTTRYCAECGGEVKGNPEKLTKRKECALPAMCSAGAPVCTGAEICGDLCVEGSETCDDGNTAEGPGDGCPSSCRIAACTPENPASRRFRLEFTGTGVAGITVLVDYPEGNISLPWTGLPGSFIDTYFENVPTGANLAVNDQDYSLVVTEARGSGLSQAPAALFEVLFDACRGQAPPTGEIPCSVIDAADSSGLPVAGVTCRAFSVP
jgi:cysteine-rich repeat protein